MPNPGHPIDLGLAMVPGLLVGLKLISSFGTNNSPHRPTPMLVLSIYYQVSKTPFGDNFASTK